MRSVAFVQYPGSGTAVDITTYSTFYHCALALATAISLAVAPGEADDDVDDMCGAILYNTSGFLVDQLSSRLASCVVVVLSSDRAQSPTYSIHGTEVFVK